MAEAYEIKNDVSAQTDVLTAREVQQMLRLGRNKVYELLRSGEIPSVRIGRQIRIRRKDIENLLES